MAHLTQQLINGLSVGFIYALIAIGYSMIYSILSFSNFAHSTFIIAGAYSGFFLMVLMRLPLPLAILGSIIGGALVALFAENMAYKPIRNRGSPTLYFIIASMGISIFGENLIVATIGARIFALPQLLPWTSVAIGGVIVSTMDIFAAAIGFVFLMILLFVINKTKEGMAIRAAAFDLETVGLMGVNTAKLIGYVFFTAGALAGLAGFFLGARFTVYPQIGSLTLKAYVAAVFGGLGSLSGAVVGSVLLGIMEVMIAGYVSSSIRDIMVFLLLITILIFRPGGLMGVKREDKV